MIKLALMRTATGKEDPEWPLLQRIRSFELPPSEIAAQISKKKRQAIITLKHERQSIWEISRTLKVSSSAVTKNIKRYDETGSREDCHRKGRPRVTSAAEDTFIWVTTLRNCSPNKSFRVQVTDTSQRQETWAMDIRLVEICPLVWWVQIYYRTFLRCRVGEHYTHV